MEIQPQLVMLQKTLLNIEGLGRELDPELDLWQTAKPYLERWMSEQMGWRNALENLRSEAPGWGSILPQLPRLLSEYLQHKDTLLSAQLQQWQAQQQRRNRLYTLVAGALALLVLVQLTSFMLLLYPNWFQLG